MAGIMSLRTWAVAGAGARVTVVCLLVAFLVPLNGCWGRKNQKPEGKELTLPGKTSSVPAGNASDTVASGSRVRPVAASASAVAARKEAGVEATLEQIARMIRTSNLEGALRQIERIEQDHPGEPMVLMETGYMKAMVFHRQKNVPKRREAMSQLLKNMEAMQKDPRFRAAFADGQESSDLMKKALEKGGGRFGKQ